MATMKTRPKAAAVADLPAKTYEGLAPDQLIHIYRLMYHVAVYRRPRNPS